MSAIPALEDDFTGCSLEIVDDLSYGARGTGNMIIQGNNQAVLKALIPTWEGRVRCVYIDPPYNNQEKYTHYRDKSDHATWLREMTSCIELLLPLLAPDGSLWVSIDDSELHYLKVAMDDIFGRENFVATIVWEQRTTRENRKVFSRNHEYVLVFTRDAEAFKKSRNLLPPSEEVHSRYRNPDDDPRGPWQSISANVQAGHGTVSQFYELAAPNGTRHRPPNGRCWVYNEARMREEIAKNNVWFGRTGNGVPRVKRFLTQGNVGLTPHTLWTAAEVGTTDAAKKHLLRLFPEAPVFDTPKPEELIHRIIEIATDPGDIVLDAFLGSGTTAAVAEKAGRRYIGIERGLQAVTHCAERLRQVVNGERGGISEQVGWKGGGGFDFLQMRKWESQRMGGVSLRIVSLG